MIIMVYSSYNAATIGESLGAPEYSYWFVRRAFWPVLERFGIVVPVTDPGREVDTIRASAAARGQQCVFFSFEPPHKTVLGLDCRTIPVFAWEFDSIPDEAWDDEPRNDWRGVLAATGGAITHSRFSVDAVRRTMGADFPVWSIPAPVYDANAPFAEEARPCQPPTEIAISGIAIDSAQLDADVFAMHRAFADGLDSLRALARYLEQPDRPRQVLEIAGVVYTAIFNPIDGRKNFNDLLGAFIWAFREVADATLILKITHFDPVRGLQPVLADIAKHGVFRCRVLLIHGMLPDDEYRALMRLTSYTVNASTNEGQCLPLMEFMSAGRPAISPAHSAMLDYIDESNAFVVPSAARPYIWPHDSRQAIRTHRYCVSVAGLIRAYRESYLVAKQDPARYTAMSRAASTAMRDFCSIAVVEQRLSEVLGMRAAAPPQAEPDAAQPRAAHAIQVEE
jgi:glycosyltransferase involved in cell wall biosynthesis